MFSVTALETNASHGVALGFGHEQTWRNGSGFMPEPRKQFYPPRRNLAKLVPLGVLINLFYDDDDPFWVLQFFVQAP